MPRSRLPKRVDLQQDVEAMLDAQADALDLAVNVLANAVLRGAAQTGQIERLATMALSQSHTRRRPRAVVRRWVCLDGEPADGPGGPTPGTWETPGGWTLDRRGRPGANSRNARPGEGWYLTGPGIDPPGVNLGINRPHAIRLADERIAAVQATAPIEIPDPTDLPPQTIARPVHTPAAEIPLPEPGPEQHLDRVTLQPSIRQGQAFITMLDDAGNPIGERIPIGDIRLHTTEERDVVRVSVEGEGLAAQAAARLRQMIADGLVTEEQVRQAVERGQHSEAQQDRQERIAAAVRARRGG